MTKLSEALERGEALLVDLGDGNARPIAEGFVARKGLAFADIGWAAPAHGGNPLHLVEGKISGDGPWRIGDVEVRPILPFETLLLEWQSWQEFKKTTEGKGATRQRARDLLEQEGFI